MSPAEYAVLMPVKSPTLGKSRLEGLGVDVRRELAAAFALDTAAACVAAGVGGVLAVTDDAHFADRLAAAGCAVIPDGRPGDLNECLRLAAAEAARRWPTLRPVAICADLPALRPSDLVAALGAAPEANASFVADAARTGTTLYAAPPAGFEPQFGTGSRAAHLTAGAVEVSGALDSLRQDVDDPDDLRRVLVLGVGPHTRAVRMPADMQ